MVILAGSWNQARDYMAAKGLSPQHQTVVVSLADTFRLMARVLEDDDVVEVGSFAEDHSPTASRIRSAVRARIRDGVGDWVAVRACPECGELLEWRRGACPHYVPSVGHLTDPGDAIEPYWTCRR